MWICLRYPISTLAKAEILATKMKYGFGKDDLLGCEKYANEDWQIVELSLMHGEIPLAGWFANWHGLCQGGPHSKE